MENLIDTTSGQSLHRLVLDDLLRRIGNEFSPHDRLPSEKVLCEQYAVSRITMRTAITKLVEKGLLTRRRGVGTFVTGRSQTSRSFNLVGFLDEIQSHRYRLVLNQTEQASAEVAVGLGVATGTQVQHVRCAIERNGEVLTISDSFAIDDARHRLSMDDLSAGVPSIQALSQRLGRRLNRAEQVLNAVALEPEFALLLELPEGTAVMRAQRVYFTQDDQRVQYAEIRYHPTRFRFDVDLVMRNDTTSTDGWPRSI